MEKSSDWYVFIRLCSSIVKKLECHQVQTPSLHKATRWRGGASQAYSLVNACHRVACLRQCLPTIPGIHQFSRCCSRTSAYETHCRATGRWLGLLCFYTSLVISLSFSLAPFIPCPCCLGSSLAGRVKFTNPYGAPRATSAPVLVLTSKIRLARSFSSLFVVFQTAFCIVFHFFLSQQPCTYLFIFQNLSTSSATDFHSKFVYRVV